MSKNTYDAIVVGSGISGGWAAKELTEKGLKVLMLERGENVEHIKDYTNMNKNLWDYPHHGRPSLEALATEPNMARGKGYPFNEPTMGAWASATTAPYVEKEPFQWFRAYQVGGRSLLWGRQSYRLNPEDFEANGKEGIAVDWPIRYEDVAPWYSYVEKFAGISGNRDGLDVLPDGEFLPAFAFNAVEKDLQARLKKQYKGARHIIMGRTAHITESRPEQGRVKCQHRDKCWTGCPFGGYFSTQSATLPAALKTGNLTLRPLSIVKELIYDKDKKRVTGVEIIDSETGLTEVFHSKIVFLNASALNSAWLLMNSARDVWDNGLGSSSGELGHNVMDHHYMLGGMAEIDGHLDKYVYGRRPTGFYIPRFANWGNDKRDFLRGFGFQGNASRSDFSRNADQLGIGASLKDGLSEPGPWSVSTVGFGEILPDHRNKVTLNHDVRDAWGLPVLEMDAKIRNNELKMRKAMKEDIVEMFDSIGLKNATAWESTYHMGKGIHEMGTARMGRDPKTSVLNKHNQVCDAPNVFVTDGACMTSSSCVNPSLTYMALTARAADFAVEELKRGNL